MHNLQRPIPQQRVLQAVLILATLSCSWFGMQAVHEAGHVVAAWLTGGRVVKVVLHPLSISRTDVAPNPAPSVVVWGGPLCGVLFPLAAWKLAARLRTAGAFVFRFFAGFCLIANGGYIAFGSLDQIGDSGEMLRHGSPLWLLWLFGIVTMPMGFWLWHRQGAHFGFGPGHEPISPRVTAATLAASVLLFTLGSIFG